MKKVFITLSALFLAATLLAQDLPSLPTLEGQNPAGREILAPCVNEKGFNDFPFTENGLTVTASGTGTYQIYGSSPWTSCGVTTKANSFWLGYGGPGTLTNTFSQPVNNVVYSMTAADNSTGYLEIVTVTVDAGTPSITYTDGTCPASISIVGNTISFPGYDVGGSFMIQSTSNFSSITLSHNGENAGLLITMCADEIVTATVPVSGWALFIGIGLILVLAVARFRKVV